LYVTVLRLVFFLTNDKLCPDLALNSKKKKKNCATMVQNMNKKSVFVAYQQHDLASDESGSEDIKHKRNTRKKKSRSKKKNKYVCAIN
jgi:hypothetical protein